MPRVLPSTQEELPLGSADPGGSLSPAEFPPPSPALPLSQLRHFLAPSCVPVSSLTRHSLLPPPDQPLSCESKSLSDSPLFFFFFFVTEQVDQIDPYCAGLNIICGFASLLSWPRLPLLVATHLHPSLYPSTFLWPPLPACPSGHSLLSALRPPVLTPLPSNLNGTHCADCNPA